MAELFGFSITRSKKTADPKQSFTQPQADDGTQTIAAGGYFGQYLDMEGQAKTEQDLIRRYREIALHPECDMAIEDIVNEAIVANELKDAVKLDLNNVNYSGEINIILKNSQVIQETQPGLRGGKLFPLDEKEVEEKFFNNLKFGNLSSREVNNVKKFFATFFNDPDFSLLL